MKLSTRAMLSLPIAITAQVAVMTEDQIGDGPLWDAVGKRLLWVDHGRQIVHQATSDGAGGWHETYRWAPRVPVTSVIPRVRGGLVFAGGNEVSLMNETAELRQFVRLDIDPARVRINDVKCDPRGRLWVGTLATDFSPSAALFRIDADGFVTRTLEGVRLSNGFDWSPDRATLYFIDSLECAVDAFDFDEQRGTISNRRRLVEISPADGVPNGMTVDIEGGLWVALTCGSEVRRYASDGSLLARVRICVPGVTSCAFGGADGRDLFITSRSGRVPEIIKSLGVQEDSMTSLGPGAGSLFVCRPGPAGAPATPFVS
jgi:sugar lactone lactonase YvrE